MMQIVLLTLIYYFHLGVHSILWASHFVLSQPHRFTWRCWRRTPLPLRANRGPCPRETREASSHSLPAWPRLSLGLWREHHRTRAARPETLPGLLRNGGATQQGRGKPHMEAAVEVVEARRWQTPPLARPTLTAGGAAETPSITRDSDKHPLRSANCLISGL